MENNNDSHPVHEFAENLIANLEEAIEQNTATIGTYSVQFKELCKEREQLFKHIMEYLTKYPFTSTVCAEQILRKSDYLYCRLENAITSMPEQLAKNESLYRTWENMIGEQLQIAIKSDEFVIKPYDEVKQEVENLEIKVEETNKEITTANDVLEAENAVIETEFKEIKAETEIFRMYEKEIRDAASVFIE